MHCRICGGESPQPKFHKQGARILACGACGVAFWDPPPDFRPEGVYDAAYFEDGSAQRGYDDYTSLEPVLRRNFARRIAKIPRPGDGARMLDVGAAYGYAVAEARRLGWRAVGLEVSAPAAAAAGRVAPDRIVVANAMRTPFADGAFDAVTLWDVIEHLADPHGAVAEVARLLRPQGRLVLTTGDVGSFVARCSGRRWHLYSIPEHLFFYSRDGLRLLLEAHGFRIESMRAESSLYTLGYLFERLRKTLGPGGKASSRTWPGANLPVAVNLFDIVTLHAVREGDR